MIENLNEENSIEKEKSRIELVQEKRLKMIREQVEKAKDPLNYETYNVLTLKKTNVFCARKKGVKHVLEHSQCQDYVLSEEINGCLVLAVADGLGSCSKSDIGSKLACEAVMETFKLASNKCKNENQLIKRVLSTTFRQKLVGIWKSNVLKELRIENLKTNYNERDEFNKYASTILFAILTKNWIVTGNLGDGQILIFNDDFGVKLRLHSPKTSTVVRCLANEKCVKEDFQINKYPRNAFNGVLISTDGIYESMDKSTHFYNYALQMKERFINSNPLAPYQAFCYQELGEEYKDFSEMRTQDDCTIALAIDKKVITSDYQMIYKNILDHAQFALLKRWNENCILFNCKDDENYFNILVSNNKKINQISSFKSAILLKPINTWHEGKYEFSKYMDDNLDSLEFLYHNGKLRINKNNFNESEIFIKTVYLKIIELKKELNTLDFELNSSAIFNILFDGKEIYVREDAFQKINKRKAFEIDDVDRCFENVLGLLKVGEFERLIFDIGYIDKGIKYPKFDSSSEEMLFQIINEEGSLKIKNISETTWKLENGDIVLPNCSLELKESFEFALIDKQDNVLEKCRYISKEEL